MFDKSIPYIGKVVWIYGGSATGKETFIKFATKTASSKFLESIGWNNRLILACTESIDYVAQYKNDPLGDKRVDILNAVSKLAKENPEAIILIKGQDLDLKCNRVKKLKERIPSHKHEIVVLQVSPAENFKRLKRKSWWNESINIEVMQRFLDYQQKSLKELETEFAITILNADEKGAYNLLSHHLTKKL